MISADEYAGKLMSSHSGTTFGVRIMATKPRMLLELTNTTELALNSVELATVYLKDKDAPGGPSRVSIRFDRIHLMQPHAKAVVSHRTWINGRPVNPPQDQIGRLEVVAGAIKPYILSISWKDLEGKTQFQRIPVGH
ncbi:MAG TPA: hypothetical protein VI306_03550 [Pyrinomonadaceae bacterium]